MEYTGKELYGGAMSVEIPSDYYDVSSLRQVPDNQEVFQEKDGFDHLIFEIMEYVGNMTAAAAARFHLEDYADVGADGQLKIWSTETVQMPHLPPNTDVVVMLATTPLDPQGKMHGIYLVTVRLPEHDTDILISTNLKDVRGIDDVTNFEGLFMDPADPAFRMGKEVVQRVIQSFEIRDFGLLHPGQN